MLVKENGKVDVWDNGPSEQSSERDTWLLEYRGPVVIEMSPYDAIQAMRIEPERYSLERPAP